MDTSDAAKPAASAVRTAIEQDADLLHVVLGENLLDLHENRGGLTACVRRETIADCLQRLRTDRTCAFDELMDVCGVDYPARTPRFEVVYQLLSLTRNRRLTIKVAVAEDESVPSSAGVFPAAGWFEREVLDLFGITFSDHPDPRRILTDYGFEGHPLRKDFPLTGYVEVRYDPDQRRVVHEPVHLTQDYRNFDFLSPWQGDVPLTLPGDEKASK
ncbi:MAG: NADH-quinone oxidoreductase subunit C [Alphaproteobacteria bacterium]|nr:MAG: NADH-quinone oxidoreductase subunit C [Alphaproteobacteria bacterium]